jgi:outer membrane protein assembly factor BamB
MPDRSGLYAINGEGKVRWENTSATPRTSPLVDAQGDSYFVTTANEVAALDRDGHLLWHRPVINDSPCAMVLDLTNNRTRAYYMADIYLYRFSPDGQVTEGVLPEDGGEAVGLVFSQRHHCLYALKSSGVLYQLDPETLAVKWRFRLPCGVAARPAVTDQCLYIGETDSRDEQHEVTHHHHTLYAISHQGTVIWKTTLDGELVTAPAVDQRGDIYLTLAPEKEIDSYLYCMTGKGQRRWRFRIPIEGDDYRTIGATLSSPTIDNQGTVYCFYDRLYAIGEDTSLPHGAQLAANPPEVGRRQ